MSTLTQIRQLTTRMETKKDCFDHLKANIRSLLWMDDNDLETIVRQFECRNVAKGDFLLKEGDRCDFWGFVWSGLVRMYSYTDTGEEYTNAFIREGGFITEFIGFYTQSKSLENFVALEDTVLICVSFTKLQQLYEDFPAFEKFVRLLFEKSIVEIKTRLLYRVRLDAQSRYLHFVSTQPELIRRVPLKYIASYLSITDSTLSRIRRKLLHVQA